MDDLKHILDAFAPLAEVGNQRGVDPGEAPACDWLDDACGMIACAAQSQTADMSAVICDDECNYEVQGNTVLFSMPRMTIRINAVNGLGEPIRDADLLAQLALDEWHLSVSAAQRGVK